VEAAMSSTACTLITGCASGIGNALATALLAEVRPLIATDIMAGLARAAREGFWPTDRVRLRSLDVRSPESLGADLR
jgi:NAD(P)-dependent dehydrogenase (short-subunit alcohol dehydrogenase family)